MQDMLDEYTDQWHTQGGGVVSGGSTPPPEPAKIVVENGCYFRRFYFEQQLIPKIDKNSMSIEFSSKISQPVVFFVQSRKNLTHSFEKLLKNRLK